jgi:predicted transcriptional regulator
MQSGDEVLENKIRRMIFNLIAQYPGVSLNTIKDIFELTESGVRYHLNYLEKNNKISSSTERGSKCFFPHPTSVHIPKSTQSILESQKLSPTQQSILTVIMRYPGINQKDLISKTGINRFKVLRNVKTLKTLKLIKNTRHKNNVCYEYIPDVEMRFKILKRFMLKFLKDEIDEETFFRLITRLGS